MAKHFALTIFFCIGCMIHAQSPQNIAILVHKNQPLSTEEQQVITALELAIIHTYPENVQCLFIDPRDIIARPMECLATLQKCPTWIGPITYKDTLGVHEALQHFMVTPKHFLSFSNNTDLSQYGIIPMGPSPIHDVACLLEKMSSQHIHTVLVLIPHRWLTHILRSLIKQNASLSFFFFDYDHNISPKMYEQLFQTIRACNPDTILAPFGDIATLELLSMSIAFIDQHVGLRPFIIGSSSWTRHFHTDMSLRGALYTSLPLTPQGKKFQKDFKSVTNRNASSIALTAYNTALIALSIKDDLPQTIQSIRGPITISDDHTIAYQPSIKTLL